MHTKTFIVLKKNPTKKKNQQNQPTKNKNTKNPQNKKNGHKI